MKDRWVEPMVEKWVCGVELLAMVARKYPQSAFFGFTQSLQAEWQYLCRCVPGVEKHLGRVEDAIQQKLIPALLECTEEEVTDSLRQLLSHSTKQGGMNLRTPAARAARLIQASSEASAVFVASC